MLSSLIVRANRPFQRIAAKDAAPAEWRVRGQMKAIAKIGVTFIVAVLVNLGSCFMLVSNLKTGVYSPDADTLTIPIFENAVASLLVVLLLVGCVLCNRGGKVATSIGLLLGIVAVLFSASLALSWFVPNHYAIAGLFGLLLATSMVLAYHPLRRLASNKTMEPTR